MPASRQPNALRCALILLPAGIGFALPAHSQTISSVRDFNTFADGTHPEMREVQAPDGTIYGTTTTGGKHNTGTVFKITPAGKFQTIYNFGGDFFDGSYPSGALAIGPDGSIYGTTYLGGKFSKGTAFKVTPDGVESVIANFSTVGILPRGGLIYNSADGYFYGTTSAGGNNQYGTVYKLSPAGVITVISYFSATTGNTPWAPLVLNPADGLLYGTTTQGGDTGSQGAVFKVTTSGTLTVVKSLTSSTGYAPGSSGLTVGTDGNLYGVTSYGGLSDFGTVYKVHAGAFATIYNFPSNSTGARPNTTLIAAHDGALYGEASADEDNTGAGIYKVTLGAAPAVSNVYNFPAATAGYGSNPLILSADGLLYGSIYDKTFKNTGILFKVATTGPLTVIEDLTDGFRDGALPITAPIAGHDGNLYGTTLHGGSYNAGAIYRITPSGEYNVLYSFGANSVGYAPNGGLVQTANGAFYGVASSSYGTLPYGTIFKMTVSGTPLKATVTPIHQFDQTHGANPLATLLLAADGNLYGTASAGGGPEGSGVIFKITPAGQYTVLYNLIRASTGYHPVAPLVQGPDGALYCVTGGGGSTGSGVILKMTTSGNILWYRNLTNVQGSECLAGLAFGADGNLYAAATHGGTGAAGAILKITSAGVITRMYSFPQDTSNVRWAPMLTAGPDGYLYGNYPTGTLYRFTGIGITTIGTAGDFNGGIAETIIYAPDGNFYGTAFEGAEDDGSIFKLDLDFPSIAAFSPVKAAPGATVTITGTNFATATGVTINDASATFTVVDDTHINAKVPAGAALTGNVTVTTPALTTAKGTFSLIPTPTITSIAPASGKAGDKIIITGTNFTGITAVKFANGVGATRYSVDSPTQIAAIVPATAATGPIKIATSTGSAASPTFTFYPAPTIAGFTPTSGGAGLSVTITGTSFTGATAVKFNGIAAAGFTVVAATKITALVPNTPGASGLITVTAPGGTATSSAPFAFVTAPKITSFTPASGKVGASIVITGTTLTGATSVKFNGKAATYTVNASTQITAKVPSGATTGKITITTSGGTATSAAIFAVTP